MKTLSLKTVALPVLFIFMVIGGTIAQASTIEGTLQGFQCTINQKVCPVDRLDPHLAIEKNFVLVNKDGDYYLVSNVDKSILARNVFNQLRITGNVNSKYKSVTAHEIEVFKDGAWRKTWSIQMEKEEVDAFNSMMERGL